MQIHNCSSKIHIPTQLDINDVSTGFNAQLLKIGLHIHVGITTHKNRNDKPRLGLKV